MKRKRNTFYLGVFVILAFAIAIMLVLSIGGRSMFTQQARYTLFFNKSIKGLAIGSPIMFRGVRIGQVTAIQFSNSQKEEDGSLTWPIEVSVEIDPHSLDIGKDDTFSNESLVDKTTRDSLLMFKGQELVDAWLEGMVCDYGLCAQLESLSLLTGQLYIELDFFDGPEITLKERKNLARHIIPTRISAFERMFLSLNKKEQTDVFNNAVLQLSEFISSGKGKATLDNISMTAENLRSITDNARAVTNDFVRNSNGKGLSVMTVVANAHEALVNANKLLVTFNEAAPPLLSDARKTVANVNERLNSLGDRSEALMKDLQSIAARVDKFTASGEKPAAKLIEDVTATVSQINGTFADMQSTLKILQDYIAPESEERQTLQHALEQVDRAANSIRNLSDAVQRNPASLIWGRKN